jgi:hypothetical protein
MMGPSALLLVLFSLVANVAAMDLNLASIKGVLQECRGEADTARCVARKAFSPRVSQLLQEIMVSERDWLIGHRASMSLCVWSNQASIHHHHYHHHKY